MHGLSDLVPTPLPCLLAAGQEGTLQPLLVQLVVIIPAARVSAAVARWFRQPSVVGEILAGIVLGPSVFGALAPDASAAIFGGSVASPALEAALTGFSQIGLILLLFLVGIEFDFSHVHRNRGTAVVVSIAGVVVPFALALGLAALMAPRLAALGATTPIDPRSFALFLGTAMSITAIPILGRILIEMGMQDTRLGATVIASAACDDAVGWVLLAAVSAIAVGQFDPGSVLRMLGATLLFAAIVLFVLRPLMVPLLERSMADRNGRPRLPVGSLSVVLVTLCGAALLTSLIGIFAIFGAFVLGVALSGSPRLRSATTDQLADFVTVFLLPIFFTYTGLRTDIGSLGSAEAWLWCAAVMAVAVLGKWGGCGLAARAAGMPAGEAACVGILMNTRALMELIVVNVGMDLGIIPPAVYCMLVLMAIGTTLMATPMASWLLRGSPYEPRLVENGFLRHRRR